VTTADPGIARVAPFRCSTERIRSWAVRPPQADLVDPPVVPGLYRTIGERRLRNAQTSPGWHDNGGLQRRAEAGGGRDVGAAEVLSGDQEDQSTGDGHGVVGEPLVEAP